MSARPRLSLCIPTVNRSAYLEAALLSGLREAASQPAGRVEVLVSDNASTDGTAELIARIQASYPELRAFRNAENLGFDGNYLRCLEEARGEFVWIMGDDDEWLPGSAERVLRELEAGADACLCQAQASDLDMRPVAVLPWYLDPEPQTIWHLNGREDLIRYFDACARNAGVFAFISVAIFRRDRFLQSRDFISRSATLSYIHLLGMMAFFRQPTRLHYIPDVLIRNRISDLHSTSSAYGNLFVRWMQDLISWAQIADEVFGDDPELHAAFSRILGRNHHNTILPGMRMHAPDQEAWRAAEPLLVRAGFSRVRIAAVDFAFQHMHGRRLPMETLDPVSLCLADLPLVARGARHIACLALGGVRNILDGAALLAALDGQEGVRQVQVLCTSEAAELLDGCAVQVVDPRRYAQDVPYRDSIVRLLVGFAPELMVNLDPERGVQSDDLVHAALPSGAIAYEHPGTGHDVPMVAKADSAYTRLVPRQAGTDAMLAALGLERTRPALRPSGRAREEAREMLESFGWDPATTLAVLADRSTDPEDPGFQDALAKADRAGWTLLGLGDRDTYSILEPVLGPRGGRAANLAGVLSLGAKAALLQRCGAYLGEAGALQALAQACGCPPFQGR